MSYTGIYGPLQSVEHDGHPRITDRDRYESLCEESEHGNVFEDKVEIEEVQDDSYPRQSWDSLAGFRTWERDVFTAFNLERIAYDYSRDGFAEFWSTVAEFCEPFWFVHSGLSGRWPTTDARDFTDNPDGFTEGRVYRVWVGPECEVEVASGTVRFDGFDKPGGDDP